MPRRAVAAALVLTALACGRREPPPKPQRKAPAASSGPGASRLASSTAFELAVHPGGATLVMAQHGKHRPPFASVSLDEAGARRGSAVALLEASARGGEVTDLSAAFAGDRLAVAWIERSGEGARARAAWAEPKARVFELGPAWRGPPTARGNIVVAAKWGRGSARERDGARGLVFVRGSEAPCVEPGKDACYSFYFRELAADGASPAGLPLSVPVPCTDNATSLVTLDDRYHYGVCTDTGGGPVTTVFTIMPDPAYARADPILRGCEPAGTFTWLGSAWLVADCQGNRRAARIGGGDEDVEYLDLRSLRLDCGDGIATIHAAGFALALTEARSRLEALLPAAIAPRGSRAVWTGRVLLVASTAATSLRLARYACTGSTWQETSVDLD
jgi:hypothetical protein